MKIQDKGPDSPSIPTNGERGEWVLVPREPTEAMLIAARDWSLQKYGQGVGNDGATGCYAAMLKAAPPPPKDGW